MGAVGGSRHYVGGGLGSESGWHCPSCGAENAGPIAHGCALCGAGRPGRRVDEAVPTSPSGPPAPPPPAPEPHGPAMATPARAWLDRHPEATLEEAFTAGYIEGVREARRVQLLAQPPQPVTYTPDGAVNRTLIAALELFRDQILVGNPEEVATGEWLNAHQVSGLIRQLQGEVVHG